MRHLLSAIILPVALQAAVPASAASPAPDSIPFQIGGVRFAMPIPKGFCAPADAAEIALNTKFASADSGNDTLATIKSCGPDVTDPTDYYFLLKVPKTAVSAKVAKVSYLNQMDAVFQGPDAPKFNGEVKDKIEKDLGGLAGKKVTFKGSFGYTGRDADCVYLAGTVGFSAEGEATGKPGVAGTCIFVVGPKVMTVNVYDFRGGASVADMMATAHRLAKTVRVAPTARRKP